MSNGDKLAIIGALINMRAKVQKSFLTLALKEEDTAPIEEAEQALEQKIRDLRIALHNDWQGSAADVLHELGKATRRVQKRVRDIEQDIKRAEKAVEILGQVENALSKLVPG